MGNAGGDVTLQGGVGTAAAGGSVSLQAGTGAAGAGKVTLKDHEGTDRVALVDGAVSVSSSSGKNIAIQPGDNLEITTAGGKEVRFLNAGTTASDFSTNQALGDADGKTNTAISNVALRIRENEIVSHIPFQATAVNYPSDRRIKKEIRDIDEDEILQRMQGLEIKSYKYTDHWRQVRGIPDKVVRGVIAQQVRSTFPEYVTIIDNFMMEDKDFEMEKFHQVNKQVSLAPFAWR